MPNKVLHWKTCLLSVALHYGCFPVKLSVGLNKKGISEMSSLSAIRIARTAGAVLFALGLEAAFKPNSIVVFFMPFMKNQQRALVVAGVGALLIAYGAVLLVRSRERK